MYGAHRLRLLLLSFFAAVALFHPVSADAKTVVRVQAGPKPLDARQRKIFWGSPEDQVPARRTMPVHYWAGNEPDLWVYYRHLKNLSGGYVGVGSDQAFLFIDWMKARFAWLIDYDPEVVATQWVHRAFMLDARTPTRYEARWHPKAKRSSTAFLKRFYANHPKRDYYARVFQRGRAEVYWRFVRVKSRMRKYRVPCFLTHKKSYDYVRNMFRTGRARPMLGNLLDRRAMVGIGRAAKRLSVPIRVLYTSNAEHYWKALPPQYRKNVYALPFDDRSFVVRTFGLGEKRKYAYHLQPAKNFVSWLRLPSITKVTHIKIRRIPRVRGARFYMADLPPKGRYRRRARP